MKRNIVLLVLLSGLLLLPGAAQIPQSTLGFAFLGLRVDPASRQSVDSIDVQLLESRIRTDLLEIARQEKYGMVFPPVDDNLHDALASGVPDTILPALESHRISLSSNGFLWSELETTPDGLRLVMRMFDGISLESIMVQDTVQADMTALLQTTSSPVYGLFGLAAPGIAATPIPSGNTLSPAVGSFMKDRDIRMQDLVGTWQGDYLLSRVEIRADGTAIAWLNDKDTMKLRVSVQGKTVTIMQDEPNSPKLYLNAFPYSIAVQAVQVSRPQSWEFLLSVERDRLVGRKHTSYFHIEQGTIIQVDNTYSREAIWLRVR